MITVSWGCKECDFPCREEYTTLRELIKDVHDCCVSCEDELEKICIGGMSEELSMEMFLIGKENLKLHYENEVMKMKLWSDNNV